MIILLMGASVFFSCVATFASYRSWQCNRKLLDSFERAARQRDA